MAVMNLHSAPEAGHTNELHELAEQLCALIASGHDALAYNVDAHGAALTMLGGDGRRRAVSRGGEGGVDRPAWQRARELVDGAERDRRFNAWVLERHLAGRYSVAPAAAGWVGWVALDIDAHVMPGSPELAARRQAKERADRVLAGVWRALGCSAERHPLILKSPGGGYHVWLPLTRGETSSNPEHTWPAAVARAWVERHLVATGLELAPGVLEVFPSGRCLRAPCGRGVMLLHATRPSEPDALGLVPWSGTMADQQRIDWRGVHTELSMPVRRVVPMVRTFVAQWEAQRRTLADWLGRPEAAWDPTWGFLGWRDEDAAALGEISPAKNSGGGNEGQKSRSQESDDVPGRRGAVPPGGVQEGLGRSADRRRSDSPIPDDFLTPPAPDVDLPPDPVGAVLVHGRAFKVKVRTYLRAGITASSTRHDAVLCLVFYWGATCGRDLEVVLARLAAWCRAHVHAGSRLGARPRVFLATCLREGRHYFEHYASRWRFRGRGDGGGLVALAPADHAVLADVDPRVRDEVAVILMWLAGRADDAGRVVEPVQIATGLLARLCGDRRILDEGKRRRTSTVALAELVRLGVLTLASEYRVGQRGRTWSVWYQFGSGALPRPISLPAAQWAELASPLVVAQAPTLAIAAPIEPSADADAARAPIVEARVVGERVVSEGLLRVLSDGTRGAPRTLLTLARDVERPTVTPAARLPWFVRMYRMRPFTPGQLWAPDPPLGVAFPDIEARRRMSRRERLAWGVWGGGGGGSTGGPSEAAPVIPLPLHRGEASAPSSPSAAPAAVALGCPDLAVAPGPDHRLGAEEMHAGSAPVIPRRSPGGGPGANVLPAPAGPAEIGMTGAPDSAAALGRSRSEAELRAELATLVGEGAAAATPLSLLEIMCHAWRTRGRGS